MTVTSDQSRQTYLGSAGSSTSSFSVPFYIQSADQLTITETDASGNVHTLTNNTDYTITNTRAYVGWVVNLIDPIERTPLPLTAGSLTLQRVPALTQDVDLRNQGSYFAEVQEDALDYLTIIAQWLRDQVSDLQASVTEVITLTTTQVVRFLGLSGSTSGTTTLTTDHVAGNGTVNFPAANGIETVVYKSALASTASGQGAALVGYMGAAAGEETQTVQTKLGQWKSVTDFVGVDPTGATDSTTGIQNALNWLAGGTNYGLIFPYGVYTVTQVILSNALKAKIQFHGAVIGGTATVATDSIFKCVCCVELDLYGAYEIIGNGNIHYASGLSIQASVASGFTCTTTNTTITLASVPQVGSLISGNLVFVLGNYAILGAYTSGGTGPGTVGAVYAISGISSGWTAQGTAVIGFTTLGDASSTRVTVGGLTVRGCLNGIMQGLYNVDAQNSETTYSHCNFFGCPNPFWGGGTQAGASFVGCNLNSEQGSFAAQQLVSMRLEGGFWSVVGGEITQEVYSGSYTNAAIWATPAQSSNTAYGSPYPIVKLNCHIESSGLLLFLSNPHSIPSPTGVLSSIAFSNCQGYIPQANPTSIIDTTSDNTYAGKIVFNNSCWFYGGITGGTRANPHIVLGANTILDMDGNPFGFGFLQGLAGLNNAYPGKPRLRGETILARTGATTNITTAWTTVQFPTDAGTLSSPYGAQNYAAGVYTAPQQLYDVVITGQIQFSTSCTFNMQLYAGGTVVSDPSPTTGTVLPFSVVVPALAQGATIYLQLALTTGSQTLVGTVLNNIRIQAHT